MNLSTTVTAGLAQRERRIGKQLPRHFFCVISSCLLICLLTAPAGLRAQSVQAPVNLGTAGNYVILSQTGITDVPPSPIVGNIGSSPITGAAIHVSCSEVTGTISSVDAAGPAPCSLIVPGALGTAINDMTTAYTTAAGRPTPDFVNLGAGNITGLNLAPGLYKWGTDVLIGAAGVTLSGGPNAVWIFQIAGDLNLANNGHIILAGGANPNNIFWQVGASNFGAVLGTGSVMYGTILSAKQVIENTGASIVGRALAQTQVTLQSTSVTSPGSLVGGVPVPLSPTVTSTVPAALSTGVPIGNAISATFSEAMNPSTININTFTVMNGLTAISGTVAYVGVTGTFTPAISLPANTLLTATITTGAQDPSGAALAANYVWTFTTAAVVNLTPPTVSSTFPANGATTPIGSALAVTFSEAMNPLTINTTTFTLKQGAASVAGTVNYAGVTAAFLPAANLAPNLPFTATITTGAQDLSGNALVTNYVWTFTTAAALNLTPPTVSSTFPANGATTPIGSALAVTFSEAMNPLTINTTTFTLKQGAASVAGTVNYAGVTAAFLPAANLAPSLPFTATITTGAQDLSGNALVTNYVWTFTTAAALNLTPPTVSSTVPANGATGVPVGNALAATFSEAMNPLTINTTTFTLKQGVTTIGGTVNYAGVTATFTPGASLGPNLLFTATITTGVQDLSGNALVANYVWTFTTAAALNLTPPTVSSTVPANGATGVPIGNALSATFSEAMNPLTINTTTFILRQGATAIAGTVNYAGVTATFTPVSTLAASSLFTGTITTGVQDLSGNALVANYIWTFTTAAAVNLTPPTVSSTVPLNGATGVPVGNALAATFSEAMNPLTVNTTTFTLRQGATAIAGTVNYAGVTATFTPAASLAPNLPFTATITSGVQDLSGNALAANYVWTFTTGAIVNLGPPTVISTVPANAATNVAINARLAVTFSEAVNPLTINTTTFTLSVGGVPVSGTVTYSGVTAVFTPGGNLASNVFYTATVTRGVTDLSNNTLAASYSWNFTTAAVVTNSTPPTVISTLPASGAIAVTTSSNIVANFSEAINPLTIGTATFVLQQGTVAVAGSVTYANNSATFRPAVSLAPNTAYTAQISGSVADLAGDLLGAAYVWTFTTGVTGDQMPVCLANFAVLAGTMINSAGNSMITGDIGVTPGTSVVGFPPGTVTGTTYTGNNANVSLAMQAVTAAFADAAGRSVGPVAVAGDLGGQTLTSGLYRASGPLQIVAGDLTLDAKGDVNAVFIFQLASTFTTGTGSHIVLAGGAQAFNVFWQVGTTATLGASSIFNGSILSSQSITVNGGVTVNGRLASLTGPVFLLLSDTINSPPPFIALKAVFNAASYANTVAAGSIASVFGNNFSSSTIAAIAYPLLPSLGQTSFMVGSQAGPLFMTSCSQVNLQIPWESAGQTQVPLIATVAGLSSPVQTAVVAPFSPAIFTVNQSGSGQGMVEIASTGQLAQPLGPGGGPVTRGQYIAIYGTGLGAVTNQPATGAAALSNPLSYTLTVPTVMIGGVPAQVTFSGLAPGFAGLYQVNVLVPAAVAPGNAVSLFMAAGGVQSNTVTIAVQ